MVMIVPTSLYLPVELTIILPALFLPSFPKHPVPKSIITVSGFVAETVEQAVEAAKKLKSDLDQ
jgi:hypothetical protein